MKRILTVLLLSCLALLGTAAELSRPIHENERITPYPQQGHALYINPAPLLVPKSMKQSDLLQFNLSQDKKFADASTLLSKPAPWCMFNPHKVLEKGTWYWRVRSVSKAGEAMPWSRVFSFEVTDDAPQFVTPAYEVFLKNLPKGQQRLYCFLNDGMEEARAKVRQHPEFRSMIDDARTALAANYANDTLPYRQIGRMAQYCDMLNTAYQLMQLDVYADRMVQNVRYLLKAKPDPKVIDNDFQAGELVYTLACTYDHCHDRFTPAERKQIESLILTVLEHYYKRHILGNEETHIFDNHFWQFTFRHLLQGALVLYDKYPLAQEYLEYSYELWTARAPASGFNRSGNWHNGTSYFSANAITLYYVPALFSHLTGTDFFRHPWYQNAGIGQLYSWLPESMAAGFGDGHEQMNKKPLRIRSAFADLLARTTGDPYAAWYSSINRLYLEETETRLFRMAGKQRPATSALPANAPKAVWLKDAGEMIANSNLKNFRENISLSFHSSPYGSGSHTHSNQNAFNLHCGGVPVYRAVGHYMNFADPHNLLSYRHTRAQNTLLVDGMGQPFTTRAYGYITRMLGGEHISYALGDASNAYCGISEYPMWQKNFAMHNLEQSRANGFGETPLKKYRRHIFLLHPDIVVIYDELEADKAVTWDWLLHSPVKFQIDPATSTLTTRNEAHGFTSVARLFSNQPCSITQTDRYIVEPNKKLSQRGEDFTAPWSLTAAFDPSKANRILTVIRVEKDGCKPMEIKQNGNRITLGDWTIEAELNTRRPASLHIGNAKTEATFSYGKESEASVLYDCIDGKWQVQEMNDQQPQYTGKVER